MIHSVTIWSMHDRSLWNPVCWSGSATHFWKLFLVFIVVWFLCIPHTFWDLFFCIWMRYCSFQSVGTYSSLIFLNRMWSIIPAMNTDCIQFHQILCLHCRNTIIKRNTLQNFNSWLHSLLKIHFYHHVNNCKNLNILPLI